MLSLSSEPKMRSPNFSGKLTLTSKGACLRAWNAGDWLNTLWLVSWNSLARLQFRLECSPFVPKSVLNLETVLSKQIVDKLGRIFCLGSHDFPVAVIRWRNRNHFMTNKQWRIDAYFLWRSQKKELVVYYGFTVHLCGDVISRSH